jgi:hypothetical protein
MKITTYILLTFLFCIRTFGQQTISDLTTNAKEGTAELESIYDLDVFNYFNLDDYNTELKREVFKKTEEYQNKLTELKSIKAEMLKTTYYGKLEKAFTDYDIKRKGFEIDLGENCGLGTSDARTPKSINLEDGGSVLLKALPTKQVAVPIMGQGGYSEKLFLPMSEETGLEIENDKENIAVYFFFTPTGREKSTFKFYNMVESSDAGWYNITHNDIKSDKVRVVVANKSSGNIYFDKTYSYQPPAKK